MNALFGILRFDNKPIHHESLENQLFLSPKWEPDHRIYLPQGNLGFGCTQRYLHSTCGNAPMPYHHRESGCIITGDIYLSNRRQLADKLNADNNLASCELILLAYLRWGDESPKHLRGYFAFAIWNPKQQALFLVTDHFGKHPISYSYSPGHYFIFTNYMSPFRELCPQLTLNRDMFAHFALDLLPKEGTCYEEVNRLLPAHSLVVTAKNVRMQRYWDINTVQSKHRYKTREEYYSVFRGLFEEATKSCLQTSYPAAAHISGGLDSSSVACMAAKLLAEKNQSLFGFTAIPNALEGKSYREGWNYHDLPLVQTVLDKYPTIQHTTYSDDPLVDPFQLLSTFYPYIDQPFRNISNFGWILGSYDYALQNNCRSLLTGQAGNLGFSWAGRGLRNHLGDFYRTIQMLVNPNTLWGSNFDDHSADFLQTKWAKNTKRHNLGLFNLPIRSFANYCMSARQTSLRPLQLWYGVEDIDPTRNLELIEFCCAIPQWVFFKGRKPIKRRLLAREALSELVPEAVRFNITRGEQGVDWTLQYNQHQASWYEKVRTTCSDRNEFIWSFYDKEKTLSIFKDNAAPIKTIDKNNDTKIYINLMRCISLAFYTNYLLCFK